MPRPPPVTSACEECGNPDMRGLPERFIGIETFVYFKLQAFARNRRAISLTERTLQVASAGLGKVLAAAKGSGKLVVDFSSIRPDAARSIAARLKTATGMGWIDAPVSGGTKGAEEGSLAVMAGGDAADIERARPYVLAMARRFTHMGPTGAGQTTKLCNQVIVGCAMAVLAEATRLATNAGIDAVRLPEALAGGFADSIPLQLFVPRMAQGSRRSAISPRC